MKKIIAMFFVIFTIMSSITTAHAADALYRMLHADEVESFKADQDAIIVGQLVEKKDDKYTVNVLKVISGKVTSNTIFLDSNIKYGFVKEEEITPAINDYCVMSIIKIRNYYKQAWGTFKADSGDYKTLKLLTEDIKYSNLNSDVACIEWYVNSGGKENDFSFNGEKAYVKRPNGEIVQVYPIQETKTAVQTATEDNIKKSEETKHDTYIGFIVIAITILLFIWGRWLHGRKKKTVEVVPYNLYLRGELMDIIRPIKTDAASIMNLFDECRMDMDSQGIHQWNDQYPSIEFIENDMNNQSIFISKVNEEIAGVITFDNHQAEEYQTVEWRYNEPKILVIHRLAVRPKYQKQGIARKLMLFSETMGQQQQYNSIRLDAYSGNERAVAFYKKLGFEIRGEVCFPRRTMPFYCMEKRLTYLKADLILKRG